MSSKSNNSSKVNPVKEKKLEVRKMEAYMDSIMEQLPSLDADILEKICVACGLTVGNEKKRKKGVAKDGFVGISSGRRSEG